MLELKQITKTYHTGGEDVHALKGIDLKFRENEFVSILGPSGCGKTTMLNIIGGLDHYTTGDLVINSRSTKDYKARDWDTYRNHSIGFVFQTYNLIPHQTALQNVELALTLSGVSRHERKIRAKSALIKVGLSDQFNKKPNEMSGGQMQRVAIARAIVNNPDIVLADEPTGALDTETSIQVMDILKEISKDRLVIMVTHNPDLANTYSTRIVKMLDGLIIDDSKPLDDEEISVAKEKDAKKVYSNKKPSMSFFTSFALSLKNLITKRGRTILTSFAGSIGIIGIALIYAVSQGTTNYINDVQEETLASYPLTIREENMNISTLINTFIGKAETIEEHENDAVYKKAMLAQMVNSLNSLEADFNDLKSFKAYLEEQMAIEDSNLSKALSAVQYSYDTDLLIYTKNIDGDIIKSDTNEATMKIMQQYLNLDMSTWMAAASNGPLSSFVSSSSELWNELIPGIDGNPVNAVYEKQYDIIYGRWPSNYDEIVVFVDKNNEIDDLTLYALGLESWEEIDAIANAAFNNTEVEIQSRRWTYEEICAMEFRTILSSNCYTYNAFKLTYEDLRSNQQSLSYLYNNKATTLKVVGIARPSEGSVSGSSLGIGYTYKLTQYIINEAYNSSASIAQIDNPDVDVFTNLPFKPSEELSDSAKANYFKEYVDGLNVNEKSDLYEQIATIPDDDYVEGQVQLALGMMSREQKENMAFQVVKAQMSSLDDDNIRTIIQSATDDELDNALSQLLAMQVRQQYAASVSAQLNQMEDTEKALLLDAKVASADDEELASYYDSVLKFSSSSYEENLIKLGCLDLDSPSAISLYSVTFEAKDIIKDEIANYNKSVDEAKEISYTDYVGLIMSSITTIINAITIVLMAFVGVSLVVSSIMIGVITLISVQERTKEIGILRAIGASKRNVSSMFNAETLIIGFTSGIFGVVITYLLCIPGNFLIHHFTDITNLSAFLPPLVALILVAISMLLTLIAGIIPSRSAAKKDPVVALRTE